MAPALHRNNTNYRIPIHTPAPFSQQGGRGWVLHKRLHYIQTPAMQNYQFLPTTFLNRWLSKSKYTKKTYLLSHTLTPKALKSLYTSFFHSHLLYCTNIFSCTSQANINKIFMQQKKTIRIITNSSYNAHTAPLFANLNILPQDKVIIQAKLSFMHSVYYEYAPSSFTMAHGKQRHNATLN